jgi:hypothetical protein
MLLLAGWLDRILDVLGRQRLAVALQLASDAVLIGARPVLSPRTRHGLDTTFYGSLLYPYRSHVRMVLRAR